MENLDDIYSGDFFRIHKEVDMVNDANAISKILFDIFEPNSVIDFGCGIGTYLRKFKQLGVNNILGIDISEIALKNSVINKDSFMIQDLRKETQIEDKFDLILSFETVEHIKDKHSNVFIDNIISASKDDSTICFSGATPDQGGQHHVNERPREYWINKFNDRGFNLLKRKTKIISEKIKGKIDKATWIPKNLLIFKYND